MAEFKFPAFLFQRDPSTTTTMPLVRGSSVKRISIANLTANESDASVTRERARLAGNGPKTARSPECIFWSLIFVFFFGPFRYTLTCLPLKRNVTRVYNLTIQRGFSKVFKRKKDKRFKVSLVSGPLNTLSLNTEMSINTLTLELRPRRIRNRFTNNMTRRILSNATKLPCGLINRLLQYIFVVKYSLQKRVYNTASVNIYGKIILKPNVQN